MRVLITGGTGFLGDALRKRLEPDGHIFTCISRFKSGVEGQTTYLPLEALPTNDRHEAIINLAGETVVGLWTPSKRDAIYRSRIDITRSLSAWIETTEVKPRVFLSGSAVGIYGDAGSEVRTERTDVSGVEGFLAKVCRDWEQAATSAAWKGTRTVLLRTGQVLDPSGGFLKQVIPKFRSFPIVVLGPNDSYFPWVSLEDWVEMVVFALENESVTGPFNVVSPNPVPQREFTESLAKKLSKRVWGRVPRWAMKMGAGEFGESITFSTRALPEKAEQAGYRFRHPTLADYLASVNL